MPDPRTGLFTAPSSVARNAKLGLELRRKFGRGGTEVGVARARDLSNGRGLSLETLQRMQSYFERHAIDKEAKGSDSTGFWGDEDNPSAGYIAWLLWGGDEGREWVQKELSRMDAECRYTEIRFDADLSLDPALRALLSPPRQEPGGAWIVEGIAASEGLKTYPWGIELMPYETLEAAVKDFPGIRLTDEHVQGIIDAKTPEAGPGVALYAEAMPDYRVIKVGMRLDSKPSKGGLSVGWHPVAVEKADGVFNGQTYTGKQVAAKPNHIAITWTPRDKSAVTRLDTQEKKMAQITIGGLVAEVSDSFAAKYDKALEDNKARLDAAENKAKAAQDECAEAKGELAVLRKQVEDQPRLDSDEIKRLARDRAALIAEAGPRLKADVKARLDSMDDHDIRVAVVESYGLKADGMAEAEVRGAYKALIASNAKGQTRSRLDAADEIDSRRGARGSRSVQTPMGRGKVLGAKWLND